MAKLRTFIAIDLPPEVVDQSQSLVRELDDFSGGIRWVEPENVHLTLKFLGEVRENETYQVCQAMKAAVAGIEPFEIECRGAGAFPKIERPRSLWIGVGEGAERLTQLFTAIDEAMADLGFAHDPKRFLPHITIGRVKQPGPWLSELSSQIEARRDFDAGAASVEEVVLYSSELTSDGPIYSPIGRSSLG